MTSIHEHWRDHGERPESSAPPARVHALHSARDLEGAVRAYFAASGTPWDRDWLVIESVR